LQRLAFTVTGSDVPYGITQCYRPPGRRDIPALITPSQLRLVLDLATPEGYKAELIWLAWLHTEMVYTRPETVTHPRTNRAQRRVTSFMRRTTLPLRHATDQSARRLICRRRSTIATASSESHHHHLHMGAVIIVLPPYGRRTLSNAAICPFVSPSVSYPTGSGRRRWAGGSKAKQYSAYAECGIGRAKTAETIELQFGMVSGIGPKK